MRHRQWAEGRMTTVLQAMPCREASRIRLVAARQILFGLREALWLTAATGRRYNKKSFKVSSF